jgi:hypothetical protein
VGTFTNVADVGDDLDVRSTPRHDGRLILREKDHPYRWFVLVTGEPPNMVLQGYVFGSNGMVPEYLADPHHWGRACWMVPQAALLPVDPSGIVPPCLRQRVTAPA